MNQHSSEPENPSGENVFIPRGFVKLTAYEELVARLREAEVQQRTKDSELRGLYVVIGVSCVNWIALRLHSKNEFPVFEDWWMYLLSFVVIARLYSFFRSTKHKG